MGTSNVHERSEDVARAEAERAYEPCCACCGAVLSPAENLEGYEVCLRCLEEHRDRVADGEMEPEDAERLAGQAEERADLEEDR